MKSHGNCYILGDDGPLNMLFNDDDRFYFLHADIRFRGFQRYIMDEGNTSISKPLLEYAEQIKEESPKYSDDIVLFSKVADEFLGEINVEFKKYNSTISNMKQKLKEIISCINELTKASGNIHKLFVSPMSTIIDEPFEKTNSDRMELFIVDSLDSTTMNKLKEISDSDLNYYIQTLDFNFNFGLNPALEDVKNDLESFSAHFVKSDEFSSECGNYMSYYHNVKVKVEEYNEMNLVFRPSVCKLDQLWSNWRHALYDKIRDVKNTHDETENLMIHCNEIVQKYIDNGYR